MALQDVYWVSIYLDNICSFYTWKSLGFTVIQANRTGKKVLENWYDSCNNQGKCYGQREKHSSFVYSLDYYEMATENDIATSLNSYYWLKSYVFYLTLFCHSCLSDFFFFFFNFYQS